MTEQEAMEIIMQVAYDGEFPNNSNEAFGIACKCMEKQIPKTPIDKIMYKECPICGAVDLGRYCMECGQAIKW